MLTLPHPQESGDARGLGTIPDAGLSRMTPSYVPKAFVQPERNPRRTSCWQMPISTPAIAFKGMDSTSPSYYLGTIR